MPSEGYPAARATAVADDGQSGQVHGVQISGRFFNAIFSVSSATLRSGPARTQHGAGRVRAPVGLPAAPV